MWGKYAKGYEYDVCLLAVGKFPDTVSWFIQWALLFAEKWCD
jgi:hypothetical protein